MSSNSTTSVSPDDGDLVVEDQTPTLVRYYAIAGWITIIIIVVMAVVLYRKVAVSQLIVEPNDITTSMASSFSVRSWRAYKTFIITPHSMKAETLRQHPDTLKLQQELIDLKRDPSVVRIRLISEEGLVVSSTYSDEIGNYLSNEKYSLKRRYRYGDDVDVETIHIDSFEAIETTLHDRDLMVCGIPIPTNERDKQATLEVYFDVTPEMKRIRGNQMIGFGGSLLILLIPPIIFLLRRRQQNT